MLYNFCQICGKTLKRPEAMKIGIGIVCLKRMKLKDKGQESLEFMHTEPTKLKEERKKV